MNVLILTSRGASVVPRLRSVPVVRMVHGVNLLLNSAPSRARGTLSIVYIRGYTALYDLDADRGECDT